MRLQQQAGRCKNMSDETADKKSETSDTDKKSVPERVFKEYNLKRIQAESVKITAERAIEIIPKLAENKTRIIPFNIAKIFSFNAPLCKMMPCVIARLKRSKIFQARRLTWQVY